MLQWLSFIVDPLPRDIYTAFSLAFTLLLASYIIYQRYLHPLARYPGPLLPCLTNGWKAYHTYRLQLHERILALHHQYGPVVRVGPNDLHFWDSAAISIYKTGRMIGKTEFYDAFTTFNPNLFGTQDEEIHAVRRRQMAHGFSQVSINDMEPILDGQLATLITKLRGFAKTNEPFDLKEALSCYVLDILGDIAFSRSFGTQETGDTQGIHDAVNDHILVSSIIGQMPAQELWKQLVAWSPVPWMRRLLRSRAMLKATTADCVRRRIEAPAGRKDLLRSLIDAKDPETDARLTEVDINTEAFAFLVAGSHTTSGTLALLFWHLVHNPETLASAADEVAAHLAPVGPDAPPPAIHGLEPALPYTMACIRENMRVNPVFTMTLWRRVHAPGGATIAGVHVPHGTNVAMINYAAHHNPSTFGPDHAAFDPARWFDAARAQGRENLLLHFSVGHRMCIGKNLAMTNVVKTTAALLSTFEFASAMPAGAQLRFRSSGIGEMEGPLLCRVKLRGKGEEIRS